MYVSDTDRRTPTAIDVDVENGLLLIVWADGHQSLYDLPALRRQCPCAHCAGEMGRRGAVDENTAFSARQIMLDRLEPLNRFGLQFTWADGHDDGLFSYPYLRDLCPCDECTAERISRP